MKPLLPALLLTLAAGCSQSDRYELKPIPDSPLAWRIDRKTGRVDIVNSAGQPVTIAPAQ